MLWFIYINFFFLSQFLKVIIRWTYTGQQFVIETSKNDFFFFFLYTLHIIVSVCVCLFQSYTFWMPKNNVFSVKMVGGEWNEKYLWHAPGRKYVPTYPCRVCMCQKGKIIVQDGRKTNGNANDDNNHRTSPSAGPENWRMREGDCQLVKEWDDAFSYFHLCHFQFIQFIL